MTSPCSSTHPARRAGGGSSSAASSPAWSWPVWPSLVARRLADNGQFESGKWGPLLNPSDENFPRAVASLWGGLRATLAGRRLAPWSSR